LTGTTTASASEAVINCLIPYIGRSNITIIGEKTVGKRVGSNVFGSKEKYGWLLHPIVLRIYNAERKADYANGFMPDIEVKELKVGNKLYPFGDTNELLLKEAISCIIGQQELKSKTLNIVEEEELLAKPVFSTTRVRGLIDSNNENFE
jgi:C-terminal processing protease CtpA/Prc